MRLRVERHRGKVIWFDGRYFRIFLCCAAFDHLDHVRRAIDEDVV